MAYEKSWNQVSPQAFVADGTSGGLIRVSSTAGFKVKMSVSVYATGLANLNLEVKRVIDNQFLVVGSIGQNINQRTDISTYTVVLGAGIRAYEQLKPQIPPTSITQATYEQEPACAVRTINVDQYGNLITSANPLPVDATVTVGDVTIDYLGKDTAGGIANILVVGAEDESGALGVAHPLKVDSQGRLIVVTGTTSKTPVHANGNVAVAGTPVTITPVSDIKEVFIQCNSTISPLNPNDNLSDAIYYNIDDSANYCVLMAGEYVSLTGDFATLKLNTNANGTIYSIIYWI